MSSQVRDVRFEGGSGHGPRAPLANWLVVGFLIVVAALLAVDPGTRVALYVAPIWFGLLGVAYVRMKSRPRQNMGFAAGQSPLP
jgi:L-asparagine transporter-like permease